MLIVVGLGVQGDKRAQSPGPSRRRRRSGNAGGRLPRAAGGAARPLRCRAVCIPDEPKVELLDVPARQRQARAGREAAVGRRRRDIARSRRWRAPQGRGCYTAYNHRFEPHYVRMRELIASGELGRDLSLPHVLRQRHGAAGARFRLARSRRRRAARSRLAPARHGAVLVRRPRATTSAWCSASRFENRAPDHVVIASRTRATEARARDDAAVLAQPFHLRRVRRAAAARTSNRCANGARRPSPCARACCRAAGRPRRRVTLVQDDPTWELEYAHFKGSVANGRADRPRQRPVAQPLLRRLGEEAIAQGEPMSAAAAPRIGYAGMTHLGLVLGIGAAEKGFATVCFDADRGADRPARQGRAAGASSRISTSCCAQEPRAHPLHGRRRRLGALRRRLRGARRADRRCRATATSPASTGCSSW